MSRKIAFPVLFLAFFLFACGGGGGSTSDPSPDPDPVPTAKIWADSESILAGQSTTIHWETTGGVASFVGDPNSFPPSGSMSTGPLTESTTYTVGCTSPDGQKATASVTVTVSNVPPPPDTTPPVITLLGANPVTLLAGTAYVDAGATALDDVDGNITNRITVTGLPIDTNVVGSHQLTYTVPDTAGNSSSATRMVNVVPAASGPPEVPYLEMFPERVLRPTTTGLITLTLKDPAVIDKVEIAFTTGDFKSLAKTSDYTWSTAVEAAKLLQNYHSGEPRVFVGYLDTYRGTTRLDRYNLFLPVRTSAMPDVSIQTISANMQISDHVFNLRHDTIFLGGTTSTFSTVWNAIRPAVQNTIGLKDFYALVGQVEAFANRTGGSILAFPNGNFFDLANRGAVHEIGHKWLAFSNHPLLNASPHWAAGNAADGIEGYSTLGGQGLQFPFHLEPGSLTTTTKACQKPVATAFNELELYKMGLVASFTPVRQFSDQAKAGNWLSNPGVVPVCGSGYVELDIPSKDVTFSDVIASDGPTPSAVQTSFTLGTTVLSAGRLLTANEMAYFEYMAARGEGKSSVQVWEGLSSYISQPFYSATGGRMTLSTKIR